MLTQPRIVHSVPVLANRARSVQPSGTSVARAAAKTAAANRERIIDFTIGELTLETSRFVKGGAIAAIEGGLNRYSDTLGLPELRQAIADEFSRTTRLDWSLNEVAVTAGAKPALFYMAFALLNPGDEIIIPKPYWQTFP